jgi:hypothetical protein
MISGPSRVGHEASTAIRCKLLIVIAIYRQAVAETAQSGRRSDFSCEGGNLMDDTYFPEISERNYEAVRAIMHHELMPTYKQWLEYMAKRVTHWSKTHKIIKVEVKPDDVSAYLRKSGHSADLNSLYILAEFLGKRRQD